MESPQPSSSNASAVAHVQVDEGHASGGDDPSLLRNVPNEVLSYIFVLCSCSDSVMLPYLQFSLPCQVILSQVCSKWRQVALSTGELWSNIIIVFNEYVIKGYERYLCIYRAWIDRACAQPLTLTIDLSDGSSNEQVVFQDFVLPFEFKKLDIIMWYENLPPLSNLPTLKVEEFAISLHAHQI